MPRCATSAARTRGRGSPMNDPVTMRRKLRVELKRRRTARALLASWRIEKTRIDQIWAARLERQELLDRPDPPEMFFILDEAAVQRPVGGEGVMRHQRARLLELAARPRITVQVIPFEAGAH